MNDFIPSKFKNCKVVLLILYDKNLSHRRNATISRIQVDNFLTYYKMTWLIVVYIAIISNLPSEVCD